ncbi:MAG: aldo/keto reductase [Paludibacter sp.]|nr:aldo/keto reductase [Paludibacter sp.]
MSTENQTKRIGRRDFLKYTVSLTTASLFMGFGSSKLFATLAPKKGGNFIKTITLNNGVKMPMLGFGTLTLKGVEGARCVADAISAGYRLLDTAMIYGNELAVGEGIKQSGIKREELFVTSKLWVVDSGYEKTMKAFASTLNKLGLEYLDLYLIHRPRGDVKGSWKAMEELYKTGKIRAIGVSNFEKSHLDELIANSKVKPVINQIESHAFFQQGMANESLKKYGIQMEAWAPFAEGRNGLFTNETLAAIGKKYNKTNAQVCLRWHFQRGIIAIPRSSQKTHIIENLQIFDFNLDHSEMQTIAALDLNKSQFPEWT